LVVKKKKKKKDSAQSGSRQDLNPGHSGYKAAVLHTVP
jgi:hypothetical protein